MCVFYYCRTYYKAVRVGEDVCYERRRAVCVSVYYRACVSQSVYYCSTYYKAVRI